MIVGYRLSDGMTTSDDVWCPDHQPPLEPGQEYQPEDDDAEVDSPSHCATCEKLIGQRLTPDGKSYVWEEITEFLLENSGRGCIVKQWWAEWDQEVKEHVGPEHAEPFTELAFLHVDSMMDAQPRWDEYSPRAARGWVEPGAVSEKEANEVYDILERYVGAPTGQRDDFVFHQTHGFVREYRFQGSLGFGGKIYRAGASPLWRVACYPEDRTDDRTKAIALANEALMRVESNV